MSVKVPPRSIQKSQLRRRRSHVRLVPRPISRIAARSEIASFAGKIGGGPAAFPPGPLSRHQPACKPGSVGRAANRTRDGHSSGTPVAWRLEQPTRTAGSGHRSRRRPACAEAAPRRPYSVLLPVGFAVPSALPQTRCALTAPFHPCRSPCLTLTRKRERGPVEERRSLLCGTFPGLAPAGRYPAPYVHGARTFLPGHLSVLAGAAVQPTDPPGMGTRSVRVKGLPQGTRLRMRISSQ